MFNREGIAAKTPAMKSKMVRGLILAGILLPGGRAQTQPPNLAGASLEDLLNMEVTSVSKKEQTLSRTGASIFVIGQDEIRRSGARNIPDLLRTAPGVEVAQMQAGGWAISIRGFNAVYANKVLVLVDGRTVYQNTFSGVFWDELSVPLEDIERIEVIRGPGGTVWGANAVNGVINIITKSAADTKGGLLVAGAGNTTRAETLLRYGGNIGSIGAYRVFGSYSNLADSRLPGGAKSPDGGSLSDIGFRIDAAPGQQDSLTLEGGAHLTRLGTTDTVVTPSPLAQFQVNNPLTDTSGNILGRWTHTMASGSTVSLQVYDNVLRRYEVGVDIADNTLDIELEHHFRAGNRNDVVWGLDYRYNSDRTTPTASYALHYTVPSRSDNLIAPFIQDEFAISKSLYLTVGSKFEHNSFTGFAWEPGAQFVWVANDRNSFWTSASQAIRQPDRSDFELNFDASVVSVPGLGSGLVTVNGNPRIGAEHMLDFEAGYRSQPSPRFSLDIAGFLSYYRRLETVETGIPQILLTSGQPLFVIPEYFDQLGHARSLGLEAFVNWNVTRRWKLTPGYSMEKIRTGIDRGSTDTTLTLIDGNSPTYQPQIRSALTLRRNVDFDSSLKYVSSLRSQNLPGYLRLDLRLAWHPTEALEISVAGQNLASGNHIEFIDNSGYFVATRVRTAAFCKVTWRF